MRNWQRVAFVQLKYVIRWGGVLLAAGLFLLLKQNALAGTIFESPYVNISEDGGAWTTCAGETAKQYHDKGYVVETGVESTLGLPKVGEHYYEYMRTGTLPVGMWMVQHKYSTCIHDAYPLEGDDFHNINYNRRACGRTYCQGWFAYCADCDGEIIDLLFYMNDKAGKSIGFIETGMDYYYLCPFCANLEQARLIEGHRCKQISKNQYRIIYEVNTEGEYYGTMEDSYHMYDNASYYDGEEIVPNRHLNQNLYTVPNAAFLGWNTVADGSGEWFEDGAEIHNLCEYDWKEDGVWGEVHLYAQWGESGSTLIVDAGAGSFMGYKGTRVFFEPAGTKMVLAGEDVEPPTALRVSFETNGGEEIAPMSAASYFAGWRKQEPFHGQLLGESYIFPDRNEAVDYLYARYHHSGIVLPRPQREGFAFTGWFLTADLTEQAPLEEGKFYPQTDVVLYAGWEELPSSENAARGLQSKVERMLYPHNPLFQRGETGVLTVKAWGYPHTILITFPDELSQYSKKLRYDDNVYERQVTLEFMIPVSLEREGTYEIHVSSITEEGVDEVVNTIQIKGTILDDLRNRLR